jgi:tetratricopeptide (TPR) repeat protein
MRCSDHAARITGDTLIHPRTYLILGLTALLALALWPVLGSGVRTHAVRPVAAAVLPDYSYRNATIAFYEKRIRRDPVDQISARLLAQQYMQRYRETGDIGDIERSMVQARRSIALQPGNNWSGYEILASGETALHQFAAALRDEEYAHADRGDDTNAVAQMASLQMELGHYDRAKLLLAPAIRLHPGDPGLLAVDARYKELTGNIADARASLDRATVTMDSVIDNSAQARAWFHFRAGEMAFTSGATGEAEQDERDALVIFPNFAQADNALARFCWASKDWDCALTAATKGADIVPLPETLGYKADAQRALGNAAGAKQTDDVIYAIERIGNAYHVSDRLLAVYYSEHGIRTGDALAIARREIGLRGDELYAQDTLAWAAAQDGHWDEARAAARRAVRFDTQDPRMQYHAGMIALHFADRKEAKLRFEHALALNAQFHPVYADDARRQLAVL